MTMVLDHPKGAIAAKTTPSTDLKIGYVLGAYPVLSETFVSGEMCALEALGVSVVPFVFDLRCNDGAPADAPLLARARAVANLSDAIPGGIAAKSARRIPALLAPLPFRERLSFLRHAVRIAMAARASNCRWLHSHFGGGAALHALIAARLIGIGASFTIHSGAFERNFSSPELISPMVSEADFCVAASDPLEAALRDAGARDTATIPCGADLERFGAAPDLPPNGRLLFVGRLIDCKGVDDLLEAVALQAEPFGVDIVGDGPERMALKAQAARLGIDVRFLGSRPNTWFAENGGAYLALVAPFKRGRDGQIDSAPVVLKEALALGLPVITTALPGVEALVGDAAFVAPPSDPPTLSSSLTRIRDMRPAARAALCTRARHRAARYGIDSQAKALVRLIEDRIQ